MGIIESLFLFANLHWLMLILCLQPISESFLARSCRCSIYPFPPPTFLKKLQVHNLVIDRLGCVDKCPTF